jgi:hypothetical protein
MLLHRYAGRLQVWLAGRQRGHRPDLGGQQDHRGREWQHVQDDDRTGGYLLLGDFQAGEEQDRQPARNGPASPQRDPHEQRCHVNADEIRVFKPMPNPELNVVTRNCAAAPRVVLAVAAAARLGKTRTSMMAPQKAPMPPITAATVARAEPRPLVSVAIAAYETASAPSPRTAHVPAT